MLDQLPARLEYRSTDSIRFDSDALFSMDLGEEITNNEELIESANLDELIKFITDPNQINYEFLTELLMTYRLYTDSMTLLSALTTRMHSCLEYVLFDPEKFEEELAQDLAREVHEDELRFNSIKKILLRTFVTIRHWILNYFVDDWLENFELRQSFVDFVNSLNQKFAKLNNETILDKYYVKFLIEMKTMWIDVCHKYWNKSSITEVLKSKSDLVNQSILSSKCVDFFINYELCNVSNGNFIDMTSLDLLASTDPKARNSQILIYDTVKSSAPKIPKLKRKQSVTNFLMNSCKNLPLLKSSNSLSTFQYQNSPNCKTLVLSQSKFFKNMNQLSPITLNKPKSQFSLRAENLQEPKVSFNVTMIKECNDVKLLNFNLIDASKGGDIINGDSIDVFKDSETRTKLKSENKSLDNDFYIDSDNNRDRKVVEIDHTKVQRFRHYLQKWLKNFRSTTAQPGDARLSQIIENLDCFESNESGSQVVSSDIPKFDLLSARVIDEFLHLVNTEKTQGSKDYEYAAELDIETSFDESVAEERANRTHDTERSLFSKLDLFKNENELDDEDDDYDDESDWVDEGDDADEIVNPTLMENDANEDTGPNETSSFLTIENVDWTLQSQDKFEKTIESMLDVSPAMMEKLGNRYSGHFGSFNRLCRNSLLSDDSEISILLNKQNMKPKVLEKIKSLEKMKHTTSSRKRTIDESNRLTNKKSVKDLRKKFFDETTSSNNEKVFATTKSSSAASNRVRSKINFFQQGSTISHSNSNWKNESSITIDTNTDCSPGSVFLNSVFSGANTSNTAMSTTSDLPKLNLSKSFKSIKSTKINTVVESNESFNEDFIDYPLREDKSHISMLSVASYLMPGINPKIVETLANIPDDSFQGNDPVYITLLKLEGKIASKKFYDGDNSDSESLVHKRKMEEDADDQDTSSDTITGINIDPNDTLESKNLSERKILSVKRSPKALKMQENSILHNKSIEEQLDELKIEENNYDVEQAGLLKKISNFNSFNTKNIFKSVPDIVSKYTTESATQESFLVGYKISPLLEVSEITKSHCHLSFIHDYTSLELAQQLTLIEKDCLLEVDWKELIDIGKELPIIDYSANGNSWIQIISKNLKGVELVMKRFNLTVTWVVSEILLTFELGSRVKTIEKFIEIAYCCYELQNYSTMMQIALALTCHKVSNLPNTWNKIDEEANNKLRLLESLANPMDNFVKIRELNNNAKPSVGYLPFIGLYLFDLKKIFLNESTTVHSDLINWKKFHQVSKIVKTIIGKIQFGKFYQLNVNEEIISKCLYITSLDDEELAQCEACLVEA